MPTSPLAAPSALSVQLYTVREAAAEDLTGTLTRIADIGYQLVEPYGFTSWGPALAEALQASGLRAPTTHQSFITADEGEQEALFAAAAQVGVTTVIDPHHAAENWQTADQVAETAARLNAAAAVAARHGVAVGYHNHAFELEARPEGGDGRTGLELLADQLAPEVGLQVDAYWAAVGGADPVELLRRLGKRVVAVHVKDGPGTKENKDQVAVGQGSQPIAEILAATPHALHVVELDDSRSDRFEAIAESFRFLTGGER
ncbi:MAG TPA: sugar phosphate isomerase/epimerase [Actinotalea caeni]|uniref:sugar phosphate isomerase/epimerase family protein n=1 Tax=Actinotalea caeni TaxID=1348467 RepID=UPI002B4AE469|nr:sugar phosphate isomerase/epimerase [Actinotalea caeni]HLV56547.1 sugar phosphate isomerase/epimerase [Actinotalea caeni]